MSIEDNFQSFQDKAQEALVNVTKRGGGIASAAEDLEFFRASNPKDGKKLDKQNRRLLDLAAKLLRSATEGSDIQAPRLADKDDVDDNWQSIVEVIDNVLEKADFALDEYTGVVKRQGVGEEEPISGPTKDRRGLQAHFGPKPQLKFNKPPTNDEITPFIPLLKTKPHAKVPLTESLKPKTSEQDLPEISHPYETEIHGYQYPDRVYKHAEAIPPQPLESTHATFVNTLEGVREMLKELKKAKEIAIDLEHHDRHSYVGLVSLMQISTRDQDWIVDTLMPWREDLEILNEVFTDPNIVKVLHGSHSDIVWLQRDLGLYVVGLFDTYHAAVSLRYPKKSLAYLLERFVNFEAQKKYQMADWRIRPLPQELLDYARSDTHFLLYIYDMMRNELIDASKKQKSDESLIDHVLEGSKTEALQRFERYIYDEQGGTGQYGWYWQLIKTAPLNKAQFAIFRALHKWRDDAARQEDESLAAVMLNNALFAVARSEPSNVSTLLTCVHPVSDVLRRKAKDVVALVKSAQIASDNGPTMETVMREHPLTIAFEKRKAERQKEKINRIATGPTVAAIIQQEKKEYLDTKDAISTRSQFWGTTLNGGKKQEKLSTLSQQVGELRLQVPLPPLTAEVYSTAGEGAVKQADSAPLPEHEYKKKQVPEEDKPFVLNELPKGKKHKKRKYDQTDIAEPEPEADSESESGSESELESKAAESHDEDLSISDPEHDKDMLELPSEGEEPSEQSSGKSKKVKKKNLVSGTGWHKGKKQRHAEQLEKQAEEKAAKNLARKAAKLQAKEEAQNKAQGQVNEAPFDYANAPSIMNKKQEKPDKKNKKEKKGVDPYKKSADAPKGMRKKQKEIGGRSKTFKS